MFLRPYNLYGHYTEQFSGGLTFPLKARVFQSFNLNSIQSGLLIQSPLVQIEKTHNNEEWPKVSGRIYILESVLIFSILRTDFR